ncbi:MAG: hypothetical protein VX899_10850 [Myxococcota bacterium]|nr:hypothetical protein [Myxococcota bacterium]
MLPLLVLLSCVGLRQARGPEPLEIQTPMVLGWRLIPGDQLVYDLSSTWRVGEADTVQRVERWSYLVRDVDPQGVARLEGSLIAIGVDRVQGGRRSADPVLAEALEQEKARLSQDQVVVEIAMDGRLVDLRGLPWADSLTHRLLALQLSADAVDASSAWPDPVLARPYADLLPVPLDVEVSGEQRVQGLYEQGGGLRLRIDGSGQVRATEGGPQIHLQTQSWWDPQAGRLVERSLQVEMANLSVADPGILLLEARLTE